MEPSQGPLRTPGGRILHSEHAGEQGPQKPQLYIFNLTYLPLHFKRYFIWLQPLSQTLPPSGQHPKLRRRRLAFGPRRRVSWSP